LNGVFADNNSQTLQLILGLDPMRYTRAHPTSRQQPSHP
jgi:hypothetical protein